MGGEYIGDDKANTAPNWQSVLFGSGCINTNPCGSQYNNLSIESVVGAGAVLIPFTTAWYNEHTAYQLIPAMADWDTFHSMFVGPGTTVTMWQDGGEVGSSANGTGLNYEAVAIQITGPAMVQNSCWLFGQGCHSLAYYPNPPAQNQAQYYADGANAAEALFNRTFGNVVDLSGNTVSMQSLFPQSVRYWSGSTTPNTIPPAYTGNARSWPGDMLQWKGGLLVTCNP
jgi:hypothetical protein